MPIHSLNAVPPFVQVGLSVGITYLYLKLGRPPIVVNALIDTGASLTACSPEVLASLQPQKLGVQEYIRPDEPPFEKPIYSIRLCFEPDIQEPSWPKQSHWFDIRVLEVAIATPGVDILIGQNLLNQLVLSWDGPRSRLLLTY